jgi:outer membrane protein assembly factor BamB
VDGDIVYCSAGYGMGAGAYRIAKQGDVWTPTELWRKTGDDLANHWSTPVVKDGHLYGMFSFKEYGKGALKCVELATGKQIWAEPNYGPGGVVLAGNLLVALNDRGEVVLVDPQPAAYKELARVKAVDGKCWNHPTVSGGRIFARSTQEGVCLDVTPAVAGR